MLHAAPEPVPAQSRPRHTGRARAGRARRRHALPSPCVGLEQCREHPCLYFRARRARSGYRRPDDRRLRHCARVLRSPPREPRARYRRLPAARRACFAASLLSRSRSHAPRFRATLHHSSPVACQPSPGRRPGPLCGRASPERARSRAARAGRGHGLACDQKIEHQRQVGRLAKAGDQGLNGLVKIFGNLFPSKQCR